MANTFSFSTYSSLVVMLMLLLGRTVSASTDLSDESYYYNHRHYCPSALKTIKAMVKEAIRQDPRMGASLLRLHFHDCFVNVSIFPSLIKLEWTSCNNYFLIN